MEWRERDGVRWLEADLGRGRAAFATRLGGVSEGPYASLNLGLLTDDEPTAMSANRARLAGALGFAPDRVAYALQVHGAELAPVPAGFGGGFGTAAPAPLEADGHVIATTGPAAVVFTADCLPVALAGPGGVAILHCGWRGMAAGIIARGVEAVGAERAAIGPGIGPCCYEVGGEVLGAFAGLGEGVAAGRMLDLAEVARRLLAAAGVERVEAAGLCTACEPELFFSHRRDSGRTGRQGNAAWLLAGGEGEA